MRSMLDFRSCPDSVAKLGFETALMLRGGGIAGGFDRLLVQAVCFVSVCLFLFPVFPMLGKRQTCLAAPVRRI